MMDKVEEAREALERLVHYGSVELADANLIMEATDAYALQAHCDACIKHKLINGFATGLACGDGWYCDEAKRYIKEETG